MSLTTMATSGAAPIESGVSNTAFLISIGKALLALAISGLILASAFLGFNPHTETASVANRVISGNELNVVVGGIRKSPTALQLGELSEDGRAILSYPIRINAKDYSFLDYTILNRSPGQNIYLLWRTKENPKQTSNTRLSWNADRSLTIDLSKNKAWKGEITELAFDIYGDLRGQPIEFQRLILKPYSASEQLYAIWGEWTAYRGWTQRSAHHLRGTQSKSGLSPTLVMASWAGLALLLLVMVEALTPGSSRLKRLWPMYLASVLIPWLALDLLWQSELNTQLGETKALFAGKTQHEKHLAETEATLYSYAKHLKEEVLPEPGAKILLLHDSEHRTYTRLKAQYYLLPQNVFNYDRVPRDGSTKNADYILALGDIKELHFSPDTGTLNWTTPQGRSKVIKVDLIESHPMGTLYKIERRPH